uniref:Predicted protein n=1 Tax=Hordeum vulgare subsp. vulgare TaxID=112509 RepID=F2DJB0_HORVV|nr:predicted protein [Hordeum vulgare subsp. vulgare]
MTILAELNKNAPTAADLHSMESYATSMEVDEDVLEGAYLMAHFRTYCENCGTDKSPQWRKGWFNDALNRPVNLCNACGLKYHKGSCCSYCKQVYGKELKPCFDWLSCVGCNRFVHRECETIHGGKENDVEYLCPSCQHGGAAPSYLERISERSTLPYSSLSRPHKSVKRCREDFESPSRIDVDQCENLDMETVANWA